MNASAGIHQLAYVVARLLIMLWSGLASYFSVCREKPLITILHDRKVIETRVLTSGAEVEIIRRATISIRARVVAISRARPPCGDDDIELVPIDIGLAWRSLANNLYRNVVFGFRQSYQDDGGRLLLSSTILGSHQPNSTHAHLVMPNGIPPALPKLGDIVNISGYLVDLKLTHNGEEQYWETDLTPGDELCETIYVSRMEIDR